MFNRKVNDTANLDTAIDKAFLDLANHSADSEEFATIMQQIDSLYALRYPKLKREPHKPIDPNTLLSVAGNLLGIGVIVGYEKANVFASKAIAFVAKPKI